MKKIYLLAYKRYRDYILRKVLFKDKNIIHNIFHDDDRKRQIMNLCS